MSKVKLFLLRWVLSGLFKQGYWHHIRLQEVMQEIRSEWDSVFTEDNAATTLDAMYSAVAHTRDLRTTR